MTFLTRRLLVLALITGVCSTAAAQTTTTTGTSTTSNNSGVSGGNTGFTNAMQETAPVISGGGASGANVNSSNGFAAYYANPFYQGRPGSTGNDAPGGFGTPVSGGGGSTANRAGSSTLNSRTTAGSGNRSTSGTTSSQNSATSATGINSTRSTGGTGANAITGTSVGQGFGSGFGGTTGTGTTGGRTGSTTGFGGNTRNTMGGLGGGQQQNGVVVQQPTPIRYSVSVRIPTPVIAPTRMHDDLRATLDRSSFLSNSRNVNVVMESGLVILRGTVKDEEEARTAEGIVRLTPGVQDVKNELQFPKE